MRNLGGPPGWWSGALIVVASVLAACGPAAPPATSQPTAAAQVRAAAATQPPGQPTQPTQAPQPAVQPPQTKPAAATAQTSYPEPRYPAYAAKPKSVDDVMPFARDAVRQTAGRTPLGLVKQGQTVLIVAPASDNDILLDAIKRAYEERGVKVQIVFDNDLLGIKREDALKVAQLKAKTGERGQAEAAFWISDRFPDASKPKEWLKARDPQLYQSLYPDVQIPENLKQVAADLDPESDLTQHLADGIVAYVDQHPEVDALYWANGGRTAHRKLLGKYESKFFGSWIYGQVYNLMSKVPAFPSDVWRLEEQRTTEPLSFVDQARVNDPEGTNFSFDLTEELAETWSRGVYQQGHLYMLPVQATGRFPYSLVDYPAFTAKYLPPQVVRANGVFVGHANHAGVYPTIKVTVQDGYVAKVEGGGDYGNAWRQFLQYPEINEARWPLYSDDPNYKGGYFYLYEAGLGTNPKFYNTPDDPGQRNRGGTIHWGFGLRVEHGPQGPYLPKEWIDFTTAKDLPDDHWWHIHNYFLTYQVRIRGTDKLVTLLDKGRLTALDNPEVRALASRYGNPDTLLADDFIPDVPGVNAPGSYEEFSKNPWQHYADVFKRIDDRTYQFLYPKS